MSCRRVDVCGRTASAHLAAATAKLGVAAKLAAAGTIVKAASVHAGWVSGVGGRGLVRVRRRESRGQGANQ